MSSGPEYDLFISHASEDKADFVRPLAEALRSAGLKVWYDEFSLRLGDNLRQSIDRGLQSSKFGIVVLSRAFFEKHWTGRELDGLTALEAADGRSRILPIWHGVDQRDVAGYSPPLANVIAVSSAENLGSIVRQVVAVVAASGSVEAVYEHVLEGQDVDVVALAREIGTGRIERYYFKKCVLHGPAILIILRDVAFVGITFSPPQLWPVQEGRPYEGAIGVSNARFEDCEFFGVGIAMFPAMFSRMLYLPHAGGAEGAV